MTAAQSTFDTAALGAGRTLLRKQTALGGGYLSLVPGFLICGAEYETIAEQLLAAGSRPRTVTLDAENPEWISKLVLVVEPRLAASAGVYLAANSAQIDTVELGVLDENEAGPMVDTRQGFDIDQVDYKVRHVFGPKALDWRGLVRIPITTPPTVFESRHAEPDESPARPARK